MVACLDQTPSNFMGVELCPPSPWMASVAPVENENPQS
jgi:hypothetical protein